MSNFTPTAKTRVKRGNKKARYDQETIYSIMDEALVCHVSCNWHGQTMIQPTLHWREGDYLYIHGSSKNGLFQALLAGEEAAIGITLLDGLVFARSAFHHSVNFRSVIMYGQAKLIESEPEKRRQLDLMLEKVKAGRSQEARPANDVELKATAVLEFKIDQVSAKVRTGAPVDEPEDMALDVWAGVQPVRQVFDEIIYE